MTANPLVCLACGTVHKPTEFCPRCPHGDLPSRYWTPSERKTKDGKRMWYSQRRN